MKPESPRVRTVALSSVAEINPPIERALLADPEREISFVPMAAVSEKSASINEPQIRSAGSCRAGFTGFKRNDVLVAKITPCFENGKIAIANIPHAFGFGSTEFHVVRPHAEHLDNRFLLHILRSPELRAEGQRRMTGSAGQRRVPSSFLSTFAIPLPTLAEQRRIAAILDQADALRTKRREALAELDKLTQSIFLEMFGDPANNSKGWPRETLDNFFLFRTGKLDSNAAVPNGAYPFFTCAKEDYRIDSYAFDCEALLLAGNNANADYSVKHYKGKFNAYQRTYVITLIDPQNSYAYSAFFLQNQLAILKRVSKGSSTKYLTLGLLNNIKIPVPPPTIQHSFGERIAAIDRLRASYEASHNKIDRLFASLQHRAFRGEL